jgi:ribosomal protein L7/L12
MSGKSVVTVTDKRTVHTDALDILGRVITDDDQIGRDAIHLAVEPVVAGQTLHAGMEVGRRADGTFGYSNITKTLGIVDPFIRDIIQIGEKFLLVIYPRQITTLRHVWEHAEFGPEVRNPALKSPEPKTFHLILDTSGPNKINTIRAIRTITKLGLKEAKDLTDVTPSFIMENVSYDAALIGYNHMMQFAGVKIVEAKPQEKPELIVTFPEPVAQSTPAITQAQKESKAWITQFAYDLKKNEYDEYAEGHTFDEIMAIAENYLDTGSYGDIGNSDIYDQDWQGFWMHFKVLTGREPEEGDDGGFFNCSC